MMTFTAHSFGIAAVPTSSEGVVSEPRGDLYEAGALYATSIPPSANGFFLI